MSSVVCVEVRKYRLYGYAIFPIFDLSLGYRQIKLSPKDYLDGVPTHGFHLSTLYVLRSDQYFCLVPATYESIFLEHRNKLVVEPIDGILISSMFKEVHIVRLALCWNFF